MSAKCFVVAIVMLCLSCPAWAAPKKAQSAHSIEKIRAACLKMARVARWNVKAQRCELVATSRKSEGLSKGALFAIGLTSGIVLASSVIAVALVVANRSSTDRVAVVDMQFWN